MNRKTFIASLAALLGASGLGFAAVSAGSTKTLSEGCCGDNCCQSCTCAQGCCCCEACPPGCCPTEKAAGADQQG